MEKEQKSFSQELCENKALISAANTTDLVSLIDEVNYSEETAGLIAGLTNTSIGYVKDVMEEMKAFNENFSEENYPIFISALNGILEKNSGEINNNFNEYMKNVENFSEEDANNKIEKLSELISLIDDEVIKDLGTDYVSMVIANSTDTSKDMLKDTLDKYLLETDNKEDVEEKKEEVKDIIENKGDEMKTELITEKFNEVFIKKDGQYFKFDDAIVSIPAVAGGLAGGGAATAVVSNPEVLYKIYGKGSKLIKSGTNKIFEKVPYETVYNVGNKVQEVYKGLDKPLVKTVSKIRNPKIAVPAAVASTIGGGIVAKKVLG